MSRVCLIAADKPLLLTEQTHLRVLEHTYYRTAVDVLGHAMKPYQYELDADREGADALRAYLTEQFAPGERVELWNLWVGDPDDRDSSSCFAGALADFDRETLDQFLDPPHQPGGIGQCCLTITI